jgi:hypothetical protein
LKLFTPEFPKGRPIGGGGGGAVPPPAAVPPIRGGGGIAFPIGGGWGVNQQTVLLPLSRGEKEAKKLKELKGKLAVQTRTAPQALITVNNILKAAGKTVKGDKGGSIKVIEAEKDGDGNFKVTFELERPAGVIGGGMMGGGFGFGGGGVAPPPVAPPPVKGGAVRQVRVQIGGGVKGGPAIGIGGANWIGISLVDAKGKAFQLAGIGDRGANKGKAQTLIFKPVQGQGDPAKLVFTGQRTVNVDVPFSFKDVKLP